MKRAMVEEVLFGCPIRGECTRLDDGIHVLLTGGCRTHVGAVSVACPGGEVETLQRPTHRDGVVSSRWAGVLCQRLDAPVTVACGIHYDGVDRGDIAQIVAACDRLLEALCCLLAEPQP
jgi:hypothetical protein